MAQKLTITRMTRFLADRFTRAVNPLESPRSQRERAFVGFITALAPITLLIGACDLLTGRWHLAALNVLLFVFTMVTRSLVHRRRTEAATNLAFWGSVLLFGATSLITPADSALAREMTSVFDTAVSTAAVILIGLYARRRYQIYTMFAIALVLSLAWYANGTLLTPQTVQILVSFLVILVLCLLIANFEWRLSQVADNQLQARRALVHQLEQIHFAESRALAEMTETLASASHDIRTPVTVATNVARLLGETPLSEKQLRYVEMLKSSSDAILAILVEGLGSPTRLQASPPPDRLVNIEAFLENIVRYHSSLTEQSGTAIEIRSEGALPPVRVPLTHLTRIVNNLLQNAIKYTRHGRVTITAGLDLSDRWTSSALLRLTIADNGQGMSRSRLEEVRNGTNGPDTNVPSSRGIGLEICRSLLSAHGGTLAIESREAKGTTVTAELVVTLEDDGGGSGRFMDPH